MPDAERDVDQSGRFDILAVAAELPEASETLLVDRYLVDRPTASARVFRVYRPTPAHHHEGSDEFLYVVSGRGTFWIGDPSTEAEFGPGQLLAFNRRVVHALPRLIAEPVVFLALDTPRRDPSDIVYQNPAEGDPSGFIRKG